MPLDQRLEPGLDLLGRGVRLEAERIERLALGAVELMVLDLNMPDMHGLEVLGFVRAHQKYRQVPIIVLTTRGDDSSRTAALQAGATAFMTKPFDPQALALRVRELLRPAAAPGSR